MTELYLFEYSQFFKKSKNQKIFINKSFQRCGIMVEGCHTIDALGWMRLFMDGNDV